jgi:hypothetical protein
VQFAAAVSRRSIGCCASGFPLVVAALSGDFDVAEIERHVQRFINRQIGLFQSKWGPASLDAARFDDGNRTLHDTVSVGLWDD